MIGFLGGTGPEGRGLSTFDKSHDVDRSADRTRAKEQLLQQRKKD